MSQPPGPGTGGGRMAGRNRRPPPPTQSQGLDQQMQAMHIASSSPYNGGMAAVNPAYAASGFPTPSTSYGAPPPAHSAGVMPSPQVTQFEPQHQSVPATSYGVPTPASTSHNPSTVYQPQPGNPPIPSYLSGGQGATTTAHLGGIQKLDASKLPNPTTDKFNPNIVQFNSSSYGNPPPANSKYLVNERNSCSPRFMRCTLSQFPTTSGLLNKSNLPLGVVVQPFAEPGHDEYEVDEVDHGVNGPIRCIRCAAYINPFVQFVNSGNQYICPFCTAKNDVPQEYFSPIVQNGMRRDIAERPELWRGSVDFVCTKEYDTDSSSKFKHQIIIFVVDVTAPSLTMGLAQAFVNSLHQIMQYHFSENSNTKFGFVTFDRATHFWAMKPKIQLLSVPRLQKPFLPLPLDSFLVDYINDRDIIDSWFQQVLTAFQGSTIQENCFGGAIETVQLALSDYGGKIISFLSGIPSTGSGSLAVRQNAISLSRDAEKTLYTPQGQFYHENALKCASKNISIDLFACTHGYADLTTISELCQLTGGQLWYIPRFSIQTHEEKFFYDLSHALTRFQVTDAIGKMRTSEGISVEGYSGHLNPGESDVTIAGLDSDKTIAVYLKHDGSVPTKSDVVLQFAVVYTSAEGKRLIRVHTMAIHPSTMLTSIFRSADLDSVFNIMLRKQLEYGHKTRQQMVASLSGKVAAILSSYQVNCLKPEKKDAKLVLPDALRLLPLYTLGVIKSALLSPTHSDDDITALPDARMNLWHMILSASLEILPSLFYPRIYPIHNLHAVIQQEEQRRLERQAEGEDDLSASGSTENNVPLPGDPDHYGTYWLPRTIRATASEIVPGGLYLMDDGQSIYMGLSPPIDKSLYSQLFTPEGALEQREDEDINSRVFKIIEAIRYRRTVFQPLQLFDTTAVSNTRTVFISRLIEDGREDYMSRSVQEKLNELSYGGFLCHIHRSVVDKNFS